MGTNEEYLSETTVAAAEALAEVVWRDSRIYWLGPKLLFAALTEETLYEGVAPSRDELDPTVFPRPLVDLYFEELNRLGYLSRLAHLLPEHGVDCVRDELAEQSPRAAAVRATKDAAIGSSSVAQPLRWTFAGNETLKGETAGTAWAWAGDDGRLIHGVYTGEHVEDRGYCMRLDDGNLAWTLDAVFVADPFGPQPYDPENEGYWDDDYDEDEDDDEDFF